MAGITRLAAEEKTIDIPGSRVTYVAFGSGTKPLVIIPGLNLRSIHGSAYPLAWMYRIFYKDYRVYVIDKKEDIPENCTISELAEDLAETMKQIGIERADVIGISQGGMIAQYLALDHPEMVGKLVLGVTLSRMNDTFQVVIEKWVTAAEKGDFKSIVQDMMEKMYSKEYVQKYRILFPLLMKTAKMTDQERFVRLARACLTCDTYDRLAQIKCPVLVLGGKEDQIVTGEASEEIAKKIRCGLFMYEGLGHSAYEEAKDFNERIYNFLR